MALENLEPKSVMDIFEKLCAIPHGSGNTKAISDFCLDFAAARGLEHYRDELNNVIIVSPATAGYEESAPIIIQGHLDMVCAKEAGCDKDMLTEGLELATDGDFITAVGTTLGGDDGIAVAIALALLDESDLPHPRLELVFTVDEETGMYGALALDADRLQGRTLLNIDSEEEGIFTVACAGGVRANCCIPMLCEESELIPVRLVLDGLIGGHSGTEIDKGRANANVLMGRVLRLLSRLTDIRISYLRGGSAENAIAPNCEAVIGISREGLDALIPAVEEIGAVFANEYRRSDPDISLRASIGEISSLSAATAEDTAKVINALTLAPNGIQSMSTDIPGLVETSLNLGVADIHGSCARLSFSIRSSVLSRRETLKDKLECIMALCGGHVEFTGEYPAWEYRADSPLRDKAAAVYEELFGAKPEIVSIHAGLECGLLSEKLPGLDAISIGPNMYDIHTPDERLSISSVQRTWDFVRELLK